MQVKKEELKAVILAKAETEFLQNGYKNASLRKIAKNAGTTIGNLYHYFDNKEALFDELVKAEYLTFIHILNHHSELDLPADFLKNVDQWKKILCQFVDQLTPSFTKRFLIMLDRSEGTKYETAKNEIILALQNHFHEHMGNNNNKASSELAKLVAVQLVYGIIYIIKNYNDEKIKKQLLCDLFMFNIVGVMGLIEQ